MDKSTIAHKVIRDAFPGIQEDEAGEMVSVGKVNTYPIDVVLCTEGADEFVFYIVLDGEVEVTKVINDEETRILKHLTSGDFFGEMALIHNAPRAATVITMGSTTVLEINKNDFERLLQRSSSLSLAMVKEVSRRLRENDQMAIEDLRLKASELADAYEQLAEMEHARHEFLTTIAHELRTPLTAAGGFLQVIRLGMIQGEALNSAIETITRNVQDIISLTNDILFLQEMDLILPDFQPVDLGAVVASAVEYQRAHAERNQVGLNLNIVPELPKIPADPSSLERAFAALLDNAIKFSPDGGDVNVEVGFKNSVVIVKIKDMGVGIPPDAILYIFDRFFKLDEVGGHMFRGVGLGLSIAKHVFEQHGGKIEVESTLGKGSTFTVTMNEI
jgi:signal transduction histidine kinase